MAALSGARFVVTRPRQDSVALAAALATQGAETLTLPMLAISPRAPTLAPARAALADAIIFVSANAVRHGLSWVNAVCGINRTNEIFALGPATATALREAGVVTVQTAPSGNDSEALIALPALQRVGDSRVLIVAGDSATGGRATLAAGLRARGAIVDELVCYERHAITVSTEERRALQDFLAHRESVAFFALSVETVTALVANLADVTGWESQLFLVPHARVAEAAHQLGIRHTAIVPLPIDAHIGTLATIMQSFRGQVAACKI